MKRKWNLACSIIQLIIGIVAIAGFALLSTGGENMIKWIITLLLAIAFAVMGVIGIIDYKKR